MRKTILYRPDASPLNICPAHIFELIARPVVYLIFDVLRYDASKATMLHNCKE